MPDQDRMFCLFPHTVAPEASCRLLSLIAPAVQYLQVLEPDEPGTCAGEFLTPFAVVPEADEIQRVRQLLLEYRRIGELHEDPALMQVVVRDMVAQDFSESRFGIQARLRGKSETVPEDALIPRREAALFLELARDLDRRELEMGRSLAQAEKLEREFKEILGVTDSEELSEVVETEAPPLSPDWGHFAHQLSRRMACWWRLFAAGGPAVDPVYLAIIREVMEELVDLVRTVRDREGVDWNPVELELVRLPALDALTHEQMNELHQGLERAGILSAFHHALPALLAGPEDAACRDQARRAARALEDQVRAGLGTPGGSHPPAARVMLTWLPGVTWRDIWQRLDRPGHAALCPSTPETGSGLTLLHLESV